MKKESIGLIDVLNNLVKGFKNINLDGCSEPSEVTVVYRSIFGNDYKDINKEVIAKKLSEKKEWKAFYNFLNDRDCLWMDLIGCDSFSDKIKKQIFFATISMDDNVAKARKGYLDAYKKKIKVIPIDLFIQLFFIDKKRLLNGLKKFGSIEERTIKSLGEKLEIIQSNGFAISFSSKQKCTLENDFAILNVNEKSFEKIDSFEKDTSDYINKHKISYSSEIKNLLESFEYYKPNSETISITPPTPLSDFSKLIARFNRSLHPATTFLYFVPIHCPDGSVGLFCYGSKSDNLLDSNTIDELRLLSYSLLYPYVSSYKSAWDSKHVIKESIKSAKSIITIKII